MSFRSSSESSDKQNGSMSRRSVLGAVAAAVLVVPVVRAQDARGAERISSSSNENVGALELLYPLVEGSKLGSWTIEKMHDGQQGGASIVELVDVRGRRFQVDICRKDDEVGAPVPPARTEKCDLFIANGGRGADPTDESQGLAVMALAEVVRTNEQRLDLTGLSTLRHRLRARRREVVKHV